MGVVVTGAWAGGGRCMDIGNVLHCGGSSGDTLWVIFVGHVPAVWEGDGQISPSGDTAADGVDATDERGRDLYISSPGGGDGRGGNEGDRNLSRPPPEHFHGIYCNKANYIPVSGGRAASRGAGFEAVVGAG